jgi:C1A family cysteine protease
MSKHLIVNGLPHPKYRGGWNPDCKDPRDRKLRLHRPGEIADVETPSDLRPLLDAIWNQADEGSCTAHGSLKCARFSLNQEGEDFGMPSRNFTYGQSRLMEGNFNQDSGATVRDALKSIAKFGVPPESMFSYGPSTLFALPTRDIFSAALIHPAIEYLSIDNSQAAEMIGCLSAGFPFAFGMTLQESFMSDAVAASGFVPVPTANEGVAGGHCMTAVGYQPALLWPDGSTQRTVIVANSWDVTWGDKGYCYIPLSMFLDTTRTDDCWTIRNMK